MEMAPALRPPIWLRAVGGGFLIVWLLMAAFPLVWIMVMSVKLPIDAFATNPLTVLMGPRTRTEAGGASLLDLLLAASLIWGLWTRAPALLRRGTARFGVRSGWIATVGIASAVLVAAIVLAHMLDAMGWPQWLMAPRIGFTLRHYVSVWVEHGFYRNLLNSMMVTAGVVGLSLTVGTLAGYALARTHSLLALWILLLALVFRALPHSVLVAGYLPIFINSHALLLPLWQAPVIGGVLQFLTVEPPTLYGQPWAVIAVLVAINQPFTIWLLRSFFSSVPAELDEAAQVDGCTPFGAFRRVIMPVMWPGVITAGLFSFLLAYNDYLVCALLLDAQSQTMVPAITQYFNRETTSTDQIEAVAAAVSITAPLFLLVMAFQRQIVAGLTAGAVKG